MNGHDLLDAAGGIRPEFVNTTERKQRRIRLIYQWAAAAACLCLIAAAAILIPRKRSAGQSGLCFGRRISGEWCRRNG